jgi:predicted PurR-regulated permease PerM
MESTGDQSREEVPLQRVEVSVSARSMAILIALAALIAIAIVILDILISVLLAFVLALALSVPVSSLEQRGMGRGKAALLVFAIAFLGVFLIAVAVASPVYDEIRNFADALPGYVDDLRNDSALKGFIEDSGLTDKIREGLQDFAAEIPSAATTLLGTAGSVFSSVLNLVTLTFLTLYLVTELPSIRRTVADLLPPSRAQRFETLALRVERSVSLAVLGNIAISILAGVVMGGSAWALGLPYPIVLGIIVGLLDLIPTVGATIAAVILGLVGLTVGLLPAVAIVLIDLVYQQIENYIVQPVVMREAVQLSAFTTIAAVLIGGALLGVVGAILAVPIAGAIRVILEDLTSGRRERMAALRTSA